MALANLLLLRCTGPVTLRDAAHRFGIGRTQYERSWRRRPEVQSDDWHERPSQFQRRYRQARESPRALRKRSIYSPQPASDSLFAVARNMCGKAGGVLTAALNIAQGERPVTLIGYSLGSRVFYSCLRSLAEEDVCVDQERGIHRDSGKILKRRGLEESLVESTIIEGRVAEIMVIDVEVDGITEDDGDKRDE
ncbi:YSIRK family gram-positive signal peptide [Diplocarpon rosae]|nr:YSIRK family gram-positive signal peptide [Diplocarpon rosae]